MKMEETNAVVADAPQAARRSVGLQGKKVVIIGGSSGIGLATAKLVFARGAEVVLVGRDKEKLERARKTVGGKVRIEPADACDRAELDQVFARNAPIDHVVIAASGGRGAGEFQRVNEDILRGAFDSKFWTHWNTAQAALPALTPDGTLVFVTAASSRLANPGTSGLAAVNGAIEKMVPTLARELAPRRVNAVSPGVIDTDWWKDKPKDMFETAAGKAPLKRPGRPEEVADAIAFLLENAFVTGIILDVDGGLHLT
jgi:NAD(P)-dependent dehydrogenase (short-subunit alcohol dehydrogenase family)